MQIKGNMELVPNVRLGVFDFSMKEKDLIKLLEKVDSIYYEVEKREQTAIYHCHSGIVDLSFFFHYNRRGIDYLSIHTSDLTLNKLNLRGVEFASAVSIVRDYFVLNGMKFEYHYREDDGEIFLDFKKIGLSLWFESDVVSDISCQKFD